MEKLMLKMLLWFFIMVIAIVLSIQCEKDGPIGNCWECEIHTIYYQDKPEDNGLYEREYIGRFTKCEDDEYINAFILSNTWNDEELKIKQYVRCK